MHSLNTLAARPVLRDEDDRETMKLLLVDESVLAMQSLVALLQETIAELAIVQVTTAEEALVQARILSPQVVIMDVHLSGQDGLSLLRRLKCEIGVPVVVVMTNQYYPQYRLRCQQGGAGEFLDKSNAADIDRLVLLLKTLVAGDKDENRSLRSWSRSTSLQLRPLNYVAEAETMDARSGPALRHEEGAQGALASA